MGRVKEHLCGRVLHIAMLQRCGCADDVTAAMAIDSHRGQTADNCCRRLRAASRKSVVSAHTPKLDDAEECGDAAWQRC
jgi:hypothetical protein